MMVVFIIDANLAWCSSESTLTKIIVGKYPCYIYGNINPDSLLKKIKYIQEQTPFYFDLVQYSPRLNSQHIIIPRRSPFSHPYTFLNCYHEFYPDALINLQLSTTPHYYPFELFKEATLKGDNKFQYISSHFRVFEKNSLAQDFQKWNDCKNYLVTHHDDLEKYFLSICKKH